jgi:hypothetical protein
LMTIAYLPKIFCSYSRAQLLSWLLITTLPDNREPYAQRLFRVIRRYLGPLYNATNRSPPSRLVHRELGRIVRAWANGLRSPRRSVFVVETRLSKLAPK